MIGFSKSNSELPPLDPEVLNFNAKFDQVDDKNMVPVDQNSFDTNCLIPETANAGDDILSKKD